MLIRRVHFREKSPLVILSKRDPVYVKQNFAVLQYLLINKIVQDFQN